MGTQKKNNQARRDVGFPVTPDRACSELLLNPCSHYASYNQGGAHEPGLHRLDIVVSLWLDQAVMESFQPTTRHPEDHTTAGCRHCHHPPIPTRQSHEMLSYPPVRAERQANDDGWSSGAPEASNH
ncbi:hypothetical protein LY78DRAFT_355464 [Colletotrichum sublineola]|nr:hypothetical protein LY78DRAFT_355464 [Colletotrichum sublineola]